MRGSREPDPAAGTATIGLLMTNVTELLSDLGRGDPHAASRLLPLVYEELRKLAAQRMAQERPGQPLQPTALVHEGYQEFVGWRLGSGRAFMASRGSTAVRWDLCRCGAGWPGSGKAGFLCPLLAPSATLAA
jgi:hypothetical protein